MYQHVLLALCLIGIPFVYAVENSEILCDIPNPTGLCYKPVPVGNTTTLTAFTTEATVTGINFGWPLFVLIGIGIGLIVVAIIIIKKRKQQ